MIQLRIRTEYSFGQTFAPIQRVIERLQSIGCTAAAIVDSSTWGHIRWFESCTAVGIQPLLGVESVVSDNDVATKMWFIAKSEPGLRELYRLTSLSHHQPLITQRGSLPRLYPSDIERMSPEIIRFAGDVTNGEWLAHVGATIDLNPSSRVLNAKKMNIGRDYGLSIVSTSDNSFAFEQDGQLFEVCSRGGMKPTPQYILPSLDHQETAQRLAKECEGLRLPRAPMLHFDGNLEAECRAGIVTRKMQWSDRYEQRLQHELRTIWEKDFDSYFLVVSDMVRYAKQHMLVGPSRGSAAGSLVCYLSGITEIDPVPTGILFERFLDPSRSDFPDVDLDFPDEKRALVFDYMAERYGSEYVAKLGTISEFRPRSSLITVCKSLMIPVEASAAVKASIITRLAADSRADRCLEDTFATTEAGKAFIKLYPQAQIAEKLEAHASHTGTHAAGLMVCVEPITDFCTVGADGIAHIDKISAEKIGLLKIDVLGLRTLGILEDSGIDVDWYSLPLDDPAVYEVFNQQRMCGIFQFEGSALRAISRRIKFASLREIDAVTALGRPGPLDGGVTEEYLQRANGKRYHAIHPLVEQQLSDTFGLPIYQEQTLSIVREIGGFNWKDTSAIRKAISKSMGREAFDKYWERFKTGAQERGIDEDDAIDIWRMIRAASYSMNRAHTYSYAVISYWCAWLKAYHPLEFAASNLRSAKDEESAVQLLREMVEEGVRYKAFDLDLSKENWSVKDGILIGGFSALKGIGEVKAAHFVELRNAGKLTEKDKKTIADSENVFNDLYPIRTRFKHLYDDPNGNDIGTGMIAIGKLDGSQDGSYVYIGEIVEKRKRSANEEYSVKKRNGAFVSGPVEYLDLRIRDDTGQILTRIGRYDYERIGKDLADLPDGTCLLVRARFSIGFRFGQVQRWRLLP